MTSRDPDVVIREAAPHLAFLATESMYADQPDLWDRGDLSPKLSGTDWAKSTTGRDSAT